MHANTHYKFQKTNSNEFSLFSFNFHPVSGTALESYNGVTKAAPYLGDPKPRLWVKDEGVLTTSPQPLMVINEFPY